MKNVFEGALGRRPSSLARPLHRERARLHGHTRERAPGLERELAVRGKRFPEGGHNRLRRASQAFRWS